MFGTSTKKEHVMIKGVLIATITDLPGRGSLSEEKTTLPVKTQTDSVGGTELFQLCKEPVVKLKNTAGL